MSGFAALPLLARPIAAGRPLEIEPDPDRDQALAFSDYFVARFTRPVCLRVGRGEESMVPTIVPGDVVVIDQRPERRIRPKAGHIFAVNFAPLTGEAGGALKRIEVSQGMLIVASDNPDKVKYGTLVVPLSDGLNLLDVLKGEVVWRGQYVGSGKRK